MHRTLPTLLFIALAVLFAAGWDLGFVWIDQLHDTADSLIWLSEGRLLPPRGTTVSGLGHNGPWSTWMTMTALRIWHAEWAVAALAVACTLLAVGGGWLIARRQGRGTLAWAILLVWTQPHLWEWSRVGLDVSFAPVPVLLLLLTVAWSRRWTGAALPAGFAGALAAQSHPSLFPAVVVVLLVGAGKAPPRVLCLRWGLSLFGGILPYLGVLLHRQLGAGELAWPPLAETFQALPLLLDAPGRALDVRLTALDWGTLGALHRVVGWLVPLLVLARLLRPRARPPSVAVIAGVAAVVSLAALSYDEQAHYHHLMHWDGWLAATMVALVWSYADRPWGRALLASLLLLQVGTIAVLQQSAARTGVVELSGIFPLREPGLIEQAATWRMRAALWPMLAARGLTDPADRAAVTGDAVLPLAEHGWWSPFDDAARPAASAVGEGPWRLAACSDGAQAVTGRLCLHEALPIPPYALADRNGTLVTPDVTRWRQGRATRPGPAGAHVPPFSVARARFPLQLTASTEDGRSAHPLRTLRLRTVRHPLAIATDGTTQITVRQGGRNLQPVAVSHGYIMREVVFAIEAGPVLLLVEEANATRPAVFDLSLAGEAP
jgi:hypothetical protein